MNTKLNQYKINNLTRSIESHKFEAVIKWSTNHKQVELRGLSDTSCKLVKGELTVMLFQVFHKIEQVHYNYFCKDCITWTPKVHKDTTKKKLGANFLHEHSKKSKTCNLN